jgi:hypothetical protein
MAKYNQYIELRPGYESVVDEGSDKRNPNLWQDYIVHEDMKLAIEKICESFRMEDPDKRRSFWIHGTYGTGKSYAAIVLKHLFTDAPKNIEEFFDRKERITPYKKKFMSIRNKGDGEFLVVWTSGCPDIVTGTQLMMEMEIQIRTALEERFGDAAYFGRNSLVEETKRIVNDEDINWESLFQSTVYHMSDYGTLENFRREVMEGDQKACSTVARICRDKGFAMFASVKNFENWIADIIVGNRLSDKGIIFIWDEFTDFVKKSGDDIVLQQLSEYCKQQPFYMFLIVHVDTSWVSAMGEETYERIMHRYHELEFHITEAAAYEMIGETIVSRKGMEENWRSKRKELVKEIIGEFDEVSFGLKESQMQSLCPIHPMTITLLTKVAGNFAASSRTLFRFMKDLGKADQNVGFLHFINTCDPDDWSWLTVDYLWDYFFTTDSDIRSFSAEARRAYQLFENKKELVEADDYTYRVFKGALILIAVMSTDKATFSTYMKNNSRNIDATRNTLRRCFVGQLKSEKVDQCLQALHDSNILLLAETSNRKDARLELPYGKNVEKFDVRLDQTRRANTRYTLFKKGGEFSKAIEERLWNKTDATSPRMCIASCSSEINSMNQRHGELLVEIKRYSYKIGIFVVIIPDGNSYAAAQTKLLDYIQQDDTGRIVYCVLKEALTGDILESWYRAKTNYDLANEEGKEASKQNAEDEMVTVRDTWAGSAADGQMMAIFAGKTYPSIYGKSDLISRVKKEVIFKIFEAAPERIVRTNTAFKKTNEIAIKAGITLNAPNNAQIKNIEEAFKTAKLMQIDTIVDLESATGTDAALAVSRLAGFIHSKMTQGAKIALDDLWIELQNRPFGHYNNMVSAYLLGFVLRFWVGSDFNWINSDSNPFPLTEQNLATMINNMCQDKVVNNTLSSGSQIWQDFKPYIKAIFELSDAEVANESKARHSLSAKIISYGVPLWALKYADITSMGGEKVQEAYKNILDTFCRFVQNNTGDNQEDVMATVVNLFNGKGRLKPILTKNLKDGTLRYASFKMFICMKSGELDHLIHDLNINDTELFDCIKRLMQAQTDTWTEEQVNEKMRDLAMEYKLIQALNKAISDEQKSVVAHVSIMKNCFSIMKVPGLVIEAMDGLDWIDALRKMYYLTEHNWQVLDRKEKENIISVITVHGKAAWEHVQNQKVLLEKYLIRKKVAFNQKDVDRIYSEAQEWSYETKLPAFEASIERSVKAIKFEHNKVILLERWKEISGFNTIEEWCNKNLLPIQWIVDKDEEIFYTCIYSLCKGKIVGDHDLYNAIQFFKTDNFAFLKNHMLIRDKFFAQIGRDRRSEFEEYEDDIMSQIRIKFGSDVYLWASRGGEISYLVEDHLNKKAAVKVKNGARTMIVTMNEAELRKRVLKAMDEVPMLYKFFV